MSIIPFLIYLYLIYISYFLKDIQKYITLIDIFRINIYLLGTVFYIPLVEVYFTMIVCDNEIYFKNKFECWKVEHLVFSFFGIISFFILFFLSNIYHAFNFYQKEKFSDSLTKNCVINSKLHFIYLKSVSIIILELCVIYDLQTLVLIINLLSSIYLLFCSYKQKYYEIVHLKSYTIFFIITIIFFWSAICAFIGKLTKSYSFNSLFECFILGSLLIILFYLSHEKRHLSFKPKTTFLYENELIIYNQIRLIIEAIEDIYLNRQTLFYLFSYIEEKLDNIEENDYLFESIGKEFHIEEENKESKIQIDNSPYKNNINDKKGLKYILYKRVDEIYKKSNSIYHNSILLKIGYAIFYYEKIGRQGKAYIELKKISENKTLSFIEEFYIFRMIKHIEDKGLEVGIDDSGLSYKYQTNNFINMIKDISIKYILFWTMLIKTNEDEDFSHLNNLGDNIVVLMKKIKDKFNSLSKSNFNITELTILYGYYIRDILNDEDKCKKFLNDKSINTFHKKNNNNVLDTAHLISSTDFQFIVCKGNKENLGLIEKISLDFFGFLGYNGKELIGKNLNVFLPNFLKIPHEEMLSKKILRNISKENLEKNLIEKSIFIKNRNNYLIPISMKVGILTDEDFNPIIFGKINFDSDLFLVDNIFYIMTDINLIIQMFSMNSLKVLGLNNQTIGNADIINFIKEISDDFYKKYNKENQNLNTTKIKLKIIKLKYLNENIITWRNIKKLRMVVEEIKMINKLYGFIFKFELTNESGIDETMNARRSSNIFNSSLLAPRASFIGRKSIFSNRSSINSIKSLSKKNVNQFSQINNNFPIIGKNYLPEFFDEINFDIRDKIYYFDTKNQFGEKIISIKKYFKENYYIKKEETISFNESNDSKSSNYESSSNLNESNEEEESETNSLVEKKNTNEKYNFEKEMSLYYHVKTDSIKFFYYDYKTFQVVEFHNYNKISKVEKAINEQSLEDNYLNKIPKKLQKKITFSIQENVPTREQHNEKVNDGVLNIKKKNNLTERNLNFINQTVKPRIINKSVMYFLFLNFITFIFILSINFFYFYKAFTEINIIRLISRDVKTQTQISRNIIYSFIYTFEIILLKNEKYNNLYQLDKNEYYKYCSEKLSEIYNATYQDITIYAYTKVGLSEKSTTLINNIAINLSLYNYNENYELKIDFFVENLIFSLNEFLYNIYIFNNLNDDEVNGMNSNFNFIILNTIKILDGIDKSIEIYFEEINTKISNVKNLMFILLIICCLVLIISIFLGLKATKFLVMEKESLKKYFFKIDDKTINNLINNCNWFVNLNSGKKSFFISEPNIDFDNNIEDENSEASSFIEKKKKKVYLKRLKKSNKNNNLIIKNDDVKTNFFNTSIFYFLLIFISTIVFLLIEFQISKIPHYFVILNLIQDLEEKLIYNFLTLRHYILYSYLYNQITRSQFQYNYENTFSFLSHHILNLTRNITKYGLPSDSKKKFVEMDKGSFCYFYNMSMDSNINLLCEEFSNNITSYGFSAMLTQFINDMFYLANKFIEELDIIKNKNYSYNELLYGVDQNIPYKYLYPNDTDKLEDYLKHNPFNLFNDGVNKNLTFIILYVFRSCFENIINNLNENVIDLFRKLKLYFIILCVLFCIFVLVFYMGYILYFSCKRNSDLNKNKKMLNIIPKKIILQILKNESFKKKFGMRK